MLDLQWTENLERSDWGAFTRSVDSAAAPKPPLKESVTAGHHAAHRLA